MEKDVVSFDGSRFTARRFYDWPTVHHQDFELDVCEPSSGECGYWVAVNGRCFGLAVRKGQTCMASVQNIVQDGLSANPANVYVISKPKTCTPSVWRNWEKKWSARTYSTRQEQWTVYPFGLGIRKEAV